MVAHLVRAHFQNVASLLEPRKPRPEHHPDFARSRLALEMDRLAPGRFRNFHALLREEIPAACEIRCRSAGFTAACSTRKRIGRLSVRVSVLILALLLSGCVFGRPRTAHNNLDPAGPWGYYSGAIDTRWDADGRTMTLLNELRYTDPKGVVWIAPAGSVIDGASIPGSLWSFVVGHFEGQYRNASVARGLADYQKS